MWGLACAFCQPQQSLQKIVEPNQQVLTFLHSILISSGHILSTGGVARFCLFLAWVCAVWTTVCSGRVDAREQDLHTLQLMRFWNRSICHSSGMFRDCLQDAQEGTPCYFTWVNTRSCWIQLLQNTSATSEDFHYNSMIALELGPSICSSRVLLLGSCCQIHSPGFKGSQLLTMDGGGFWSCFEYAGKDMQSFKHTGIGILVCRWEQNFVLQEALSH